MSDNGDHQISSPRRESAPYFEIANHSNLHLQMNPTMAGHVSCLILEAFEDGDPPAIFAFAKKLEAYAGGSGKLDSHADEPIAHAV